MNIREIAPRLAAGVAPSGEEWAFHAGPVAAVLEAATTCWVVPCLADGRTAAVWMSSGRLHIPGGTLEDGEGWREAADRELIEELGARIETMEVFGALMSADRVRLTAIAEISDPRGPAEPETDGTHVLEVRTGAPEAIIKALDEDNQPVLADIYRLAFALRSDQTQAKAR